MPFISIEGDIGLDKSTLLDRIQKSVIQKDHKNSILFPTRKNIQFHYNFLLLNNDI
jgi:hypothetical protein